MTNNKPKEKKSTNRRSVVNDMKIGKKIYIHVKTRD